MRKASANSNFNVDKLSHVSFYKVGQPSEHDLAGHMVNSGSKQSLLSVNLTSMPVKQSGQLESPLAGAGADEPSRNTSRLRGQISAASPRVFNKQINAGSFTVNARPTLISPPPQREGTASNLGLT